MRRKDNIMRKCILLIMCLLFAAGSSFLYAQECSRDRDYDGADIYQLEPQKEHTVRFKRMMRDLEREYQEGSLTRTEYIQRKREIKALEE